MSEFRGTTTNPDPRIYKYSINGEKATAEQVIKALEKELAESEYQNTLLAQRILDESKD